MQVTLGDEGSGFSNVWLLFLLPLENIGEAWPLLRLPLVLNFLLREAERETGGSREERDWPSRDLEEIFMEEEEEERREVKQMKSSLVVVAVVELGVRCGLMSESIVIIIIIVVMVPPLE